MANRGFVMRPRNRRRVVTGAKVLVVIAAIVAAVSLLPSSPKHGAALSTGSGSSGGPVVISASDLTGKLVYGMTKQQVLGRIGTPTKALRDRTAGMNCSQYAVNRILGGHTYNAVRVCFVNGLYAVKYYKVDGSWVYSRADFAAGSS